MSGVAFTTLRHGHRRRGEVSPTYTSWRGMIERCTRPSHIGYSKYGGRGIKVCDRWRVFDNFLEDMGERPDGCTLDRVDNSGNYEPANCRWATTSTQALNRRPRRARDPERVARRLALAAAGLSSAEIAAREGVTRQAIKYTLGRYNPDGSVSA